MKIKKEHYPVPHHFSIRKSGAGFTLIELLVVISIISLLSSIMVSSLNVARVKAHNAQRVGQFKELSKAFELYYLDHGEYPNFPAQVPINSWETDWQDFLGVALSSYINPLPIPLYTPSTNWWYYHYTYIGSKGLSFYENDTSKCIRFYDAFYLYTSPLNYPTPQSQSDNGVNPNKYEILGGNYTITNGLPCTPP